VGSGEKLQSLDDAEGASSLVPHDEQGYLIMFDQPIDLTEAQ
jgi:hypothetical protein